MPLSQEYIKKVSETPNWLQIGETPEQYKERLGLNMVQEQPVIEPTQQPTMKDLGLDIGITPYDQEIERLQSERFSTLQEPAPTREGVRKEITDMFQAQIDALNRAAAEEKARLSTRYAEIGKRRLGTERAQQASTGMLGQVSGESVIRGVESATAEELGQQQRAVDTALAEKLGALSSEARRLELDEYNSRIQARQGTLQDKLNYYSNRATQALNRVNTLAQSAILQGVDLSSPENETYLNTYAKQIGVSPETLKTSYLNAKQTAETEKLKKERETKTFETDIATKEQALEKAKFELENNKTLSPLEKRKLETEIMEKETNIAKIYHEMAQPTKAEQGAGELKISALQSSQDLLNKFKEGKGTSAVGKGGGAIRLVSGLIGGTNVEDFKVQFDNLKSLLSLENVKYLKGQGQVSDAERKLLADASAKLSMSQSEKEFENSLEDIVKALGGNTIEATFNFDKFNLPN